MILYEIAEKTKKRIKAMKKRTDPDELAQRAAALSPDTGFPFEKALSGPELSFICEVKKASPSKGIIDEEFDYLSIARQYERSGASAVSVLTEPDFFLGSFGYLREIADEVNLPVLCKDFIIDACQIYEAKLSGASAVLLICALHDTRTLSGFISLAHSLVFPRWSKLMTKRKSVRRWMPGPGS
jgi:indole-3-glycerol phosphate synthase